MFAVIPQWINPPPHPCPPLPTHYTPLPTVYTPSSPTLYTLFQRVIPHTQGIILLRIIPHPPLRGNELSSRSKTQIATTINSDINIGLFYSTNESVLTHHCKNLGIKVSKKASSFLLVHYCDRLFGIVLMKLYQSCE